MAMFGILARVYWHIESRARRRGNSFARSDGRGTCVGDRSSGQIARVRAHIFIYNVVHSAEDYGTITTYLRMQGVMPPSSAIDERPAGGYSGW